MNQWLLFSAFRGHCLCGRTSFVTFQGITPNQYSRISLSLVGRGKQDGVVFPCAVAVMLHTLERSYTYCRRGYVGHNILPGRLERAGRLAI
jgi:hypothetical protein